MLDNDYLTKIKKGNLFFVCIVYIFTFLKFNITLYYNILQYKNFFASFFFKYLNTSRK